MTLCKKRMKHHISCGENIVMKLIESIFKLFLILLVTIDGSGGDYLSNEIFYRVAVLQNYLGLNSTLKSGHLHSPILSINNLIQAKNRYTKCQINYTRCNSRIPFRTDIIASCWEDPHEAFKVGVC